MGKKNRRSPAFWIGLVGLTALLATGLASTYIVTRARRDFEDMHSRMIGRPVPPMKLTKVMLSRDQLIILEFTWDEVSKSGLVGTIQMYWGLRDMYIIDPPPEATATDSN